MKYWHLQILLINPVKLILSVDVSRESDHMVRFAEFYLVSYIHFFFLGVLHRLLWNSEDQALTSFLDQPITLLAFSDSRWVIALSI